MNDYNDRIWNKIFKLKPEPFRIRRSLRNVELNQVIMTRYGVLIKLSVFEKLVLYFRRSESL